MQAKARGDLITSEGFGVTSTDCFQMTIEDAEASYREMAADEQREAEALEWIEGTIQYYEDNDA